ncbi:uncharacterized protein LOC107850041 [Capsicum annuum]|uniref:uncharacterized protein LOC107850041 n=1 Tax=Capsicum annuum TaxID=4072 RepID=UPI001FB12154|nr:uncharacterized protein LOC107850041 [Capsicum annuum]
MQVELPCSGMMISLILLQWGFYTKKFNTKFRYLLRLLGSPALTYIYKDQNRLADSLAKRAISTTQPSVLPTAGPLMDTTMFWTPPQDLLIILGADKRGDFITGRVKTLRVLPPSTSINIPTSTVFSDNGWSVNNAQYADTTVAVLSNDSPKTFRYGANII